MVLRQALESARKEPIPAYEQAEAEAERDRVWFTPVVWRYTPSSGGQLRCLPVFNSWGERILRNF